MVSKPHIQLEALHGLARALAGGEFRARAVLDRACAAVAEGFGFERVGIVRYVPETSTLIPFAAHGLTKDELAVLPTALPIGRFGAFLTLHAELLCETLDIYPGERMLDVGGGSGTASLAAARRFADVTCTDFVDCRPSDSISRTAPYAGLGRVVYSGGGGALMSCERNM